MEFIKTPQKNQISENFVKRFLLLLHKDKLEDHRAKLKARIFNTSLHTYTQTHTKDYQKEDNQVRFDQTTASVSRSSMMLRVNTYCLSTILVSDLFINIDLFIRLSYLSVFIH